MSPEKPMCRSPDDGEHGVEVLALAAVQGNLDKVLDDLHPLQLVGLAHDLRSYPEGFLVDHLLELLQIIRASLRLELEEVVDVLGGFDLAEELEIPHRELCGHLHCAELQQGDVTLPQEVLCIFV